MKRPLAKWEVPIITNRLWGHRVTYVVAASTMARAIALALTLHSGPVSADAIGLVCRVP